MLLSIYTSCEKSNNNTEIWNTEFYEILDLNLDFTDSNTTKKERERLFLYSNHEST